MKDIERGGCMKSGSLMRWPAFIEEAAKIAAVGHRDTQVFYRSRELVL
jgi:hypothetical protein